MCLDDKSIDWLAGLLAEAAAVEIMPRWRRLAAGDIRRKTSATDLVTEADVIAGEHGIDCAPRPELAHGATTRTVGLIERLCDDPVQSGLRAIRAPSPLSG